jgi:hypothetical protein
MIKEAKVYTSIPKYNLWWSTEEVKVKLHVFCMSVQLLPPFCKLGLGSVYAGGIHSFIYWSTIDTSRITFHGCGYLSIIHYATMHESNSRSRMGFVLLNMWQVDSQCDH